MNAPTRIGVFGAGQALRQLYMPAIALQQDFVVAATADPAAEADFHSPEDLLDQHDVDAVIVLSPARLHAEQVGIAIARGLPVLVEKPPAVSVAEVESWSRPDLVTPAFSRRYWDAYRVQRPDVRRFAFHLETNPDTWGAQHVESPVRDLLPHAADLATWLSGSAIESVVEVSRTALRASGAFRLTNGARFDWHVAHGQAHIEALSYDGRKVSPPGAGRMGEAIRRLRRRPPEAVAGVSAMLSDWRASFAGKRPSSLPGIEAARSCAAAIEAVEGVASLSRP